MYKKWLHMVAFVLVILGGLNYGLWGIFTYDLIEHLFRSVPTIQEAVYVLIAVAAVYLALTHTADCKVCATSKPHEKLHHE
jgi:uncharacterized membrane protein YuzA (DUF378 family)